MVRPNKYKKVEGIMIMNPEYIQWKRTKKYIKIEGVMKMNPEYMKWKMTPEYSKWKTNMTNMLKDIPTTKQQKKNNYKSYTTIMASMPRKYVRINRVMKMNPEYIEWKNRQSETLFGLIVLNAADAQIQEKLAAHPEAVKERVMWKFKGNYEEFECLLLHVAVALKRSELVIKALLNAHREQIVKENTNETDELLQIPLAYGDTTTTYYSEYYCLQLACKNIASESVVRMLLDAYPDAVNQAPAPLYTAIENYASAEVVRMILDANPHEACLQATQQKR